MFQFNQFYHLHSSQILDRDDELQGLQEADRHGLVARRSAYFYTGALKFITSVIGRMDQYYQLQHHPHQSRYWERYDELQGPCK